MLGTRDLGTEFQVEVPNNGNHQKKSDSRATILVTASENPRKTEKSNFKLHSPKIFFIQFAPQMTSTSFNKLSHF